MRRRDSDPHAYTGRNSDTNGNTRRPRDANPHPGRWLHGQRSLASGDLTEPARLFRADPASTCAVPHPFPGPSGTGPFFYDTYSFPNTTGSAQCVTVTIDTACQGTSFVHASAYMNSFDPNNLGTNYLADIGASPDGVTPKTFSFNLPAGQTAVVVVNSTTS